jgi:hypothetical protein
VVSQENRTRVGTSMARFPTAVIEKLGYYVYSLADPRNGRVFYVGKGTGNRVFRHATGILRGTKRTDKIRQIRQIRSGGRNVRYKIIRHGMTNDVALEVEAALIDYIGLGDLTNLVLGHRVREHGCMNVRDIVATYRSENLRIREPVVLIIVNKLYRNLMSAEQLYEITRGNWGMGDRRLGAKYAVSVYRGLVREVYEIRSWCRARARTRQQKRQDRWRFSGVVAKNLRHYVGGSVRHFLGRGAQTPFRYVNR